MGGVQAGLIVSLRIAKVYHIEWPMTCMAVLSAALLAAGVLRHYWDIWIHRTVRGISFIFVGIDAAGDLFSLISVFFQPSLDVPGMAIYGTELLLWLGVFACGGYFNFLPWTRRELKRRRERPRRDESRERGEEPPRSQEHDAPQPATGVALHDMPSSTSVFQTPSGSISSIRERPLAVKNNSDMPEQSGVSDV